jgi:oligoendopeptidase F
MPAGRFPQTWDLVTLFPALETAEFRAILDQFRAQLERLATEADQLPPLSSDRSVIGKWESFLQSAQTVDARATDLRAVVECHAAADAENKLYQQLEAELTALTPWRDRLTAAIDFGLKAVSADELTTTLGHSTLLTGLRDFLSIRKQMAALRLPREQDLLVNELAVDGIHGWSRLYDRLSGALRVAVVERGKTVEKSPGQVLFDAPQRSVRENNFYAADAAWSTLQDTCADALNHISGTRLTVYRRAGIRDHLEVPLRYNRMTRETLETMWGTIVEQRPILAKYLAKKAELLGLSRLAWYDLSAPLPVIPGAPSEDEIPYDQGCDWIIAAFQQFSPELGQFAKLALEQRWIEAENRSGKRQGGFCTTLPVARQSRIFMTYTNSADSLSTLAHELGHAYHSWVLRDQPWFLADYPMNLAETASTFAEAVLGEQRLQRAATDYQRLALLEGLLSDAVAFLMNIHARFVFEDAFYRQRPQGELTAEQLCHLMEQAQQSCYCQALASDGYNPRFWVSKLHFYMSTVPFYNFPYTFGYLLSMGLYAIGRQAGPEFPEAYRRLLLATGRMSAEEVVQSSFGFDLRQPDFWKQSLDLISQKVDEFVALADRVLVQTRRL